MPILSTVRAVKVPRLVIFVCAAVDKVPFKAPLTVRLLSVPTEVILVCAAVNIVPVRFPVTFPVSAPTKVVAVAVPSTSSRVLGVVVPIPVSYTHLTLPTKRIV